MVKYIEASFVGDGKVGGGMLHQTLRDILTALIYGVMQGRISILVYDGGVGPMGQQQVQHTDIAFGHCHEQRRMVLFGPYVHAGTSLQRI